MIMMTSASSTDLNSCVPADVPNVVFRPYPVGEWQTRAHVSTLLLLNTARTSFCIRNVSSFVQRDDVTAPTESRPYCCWMRLNSEATYAMASFQLTSFHGSSMDFRIIGFRMRSGCVVYPKAKRPFTQECPSLACPFLFGTIRTTWLPLISALNEHPTPQYAQVVSTTRSGWP